MKAHWRGWGGTVVAVVSMNCKKNKLNIFNYSHPNTKYLIHSRSSSSNTENCQLAIESSWFLIDLFFKNHSSLYLKNTECLTDSCLECVATNSSAFVHMNRSIKTRRQNIYIIS
jgi:hypothetical protein